MRFVRARADATSYDRTRRGTIHSEMTMSVRPPAISQQSRLVAAALLSAAASLAPLPAQAQSVEEFYRKTPVQLLIGFPVANAYDTYGRAVARHLGKHIPGNPTVIPVNRPGAGSLTAANFLYNAAPKDGATIAHFNRSIPLEPLMGNTAAKFDGRKFTWLGSVGNEVSVCVGWHTAAVKTWSDLLTKEFVAGAAGLGADTGVFPTVLKNLFGAKIKIITGYPGGGEMSIAMERREIDGRCGWSWSGVKSSKPEWLSGKQINVLVQLGLQKTAELPDVPLIIDQATNDEQRADPQARLQPPGIRLAVRGAAGYPRRSRAGVARRLCGDARGSGVPRGREEDPDRRQSGLRGRGRPADRRALCQPGAGLAKLRSVTSAQ